MIHGTVRWIVHWSWWALRLDDDKQPNFTSMSRHNASISTHSASRTHRAIEILLSLIAFRLGLPIPVYRIPGYRRKSGRY